MLTNLNMKNMQLVRNKKQKAKKLSIFLLILVLLSVVYAGLSIVGYETYNSEYQRDLSRAQAGMQHLQMAEALLKALPKNPFDAQTVSQAQHEFVAASNAFIQVNDDLQSLPGMSTSIPVYGHLLRAAGNSGRALILGPCGRRLALMGLLAVFWNRRRAIKCAHANGSESQK